jgi:hypothetical protein
MASPVTFAHPQVASPPRAAARLLALARQNLRSYQPKADGANDWGRTTITLLSTEGNFASDRQAPAAS